MAVKPIKKRVKVIPAQASRHASIQKDIETLRQAAQVNQPAVVEEQVVEQPVVEEPVVEQPVVEEPVVEEPVIEQPVVEEPVVVAPKVEEPVVQEELSIFSDIKKPTQEDKHITDKATDVVTTLSEQAAEVDLTDEKAAKKQSDQVRAGIFVEVMDVIFMLLCLFITWDFSHENQKRFTLNPDRKKAIQFNLFKIYQLDNKKREPKKDVWLLILGSYAPMLVIAVISLIARLRKKQEAKNEAMKQYQQQVVISQSVEQEQPLNTQFQQQPVVQPVVQPQQNILNSLNKKPKKRGVKPGVKRGPYTKKK